MNIFVERIEGAQDNFLAWVKSEQVFNAGVQFQLIQPFVADPIFGPGPIAKLVRLATLVQD